MQKNVANYIQTHLKAGIKTFYTLQKEVRSMQKQPSWKAGVALGKKILKSKMVTKKWPQGC